MTGSLAKLEQPQEDIQSWPPSGRDWMDDVFICPKTGGTLHDGYVVEDGILRAFVDDEAETDRVSGTVKSFYEDAPFPNYNDFDSIGSFIKSARSNIFVKMLGGEIAKGQVVLEVGCGTGQLSNYLAATSFARVIAADMTMASLRLGVRFARNNHISRVRFVQMNLFRPCIRPGTVDVLISNGVLHHTADTRKAFGCAAKLVKSGGHLVIGLYNTIGRLHTDMRRSLYKAFGPSVLGLDPHLRKNISPEKRRAWIRDQYEHPCERKHRMDEVLRWFSEENVEFVSSVPSIGEPFSDRERLFEKRSPGSRAERFLAEAGMLFGSYGGEGGLFIMIGRKK
ncbi:MAG: class I SAM-dependent methyltransferase [Bdellovibrionales bacterium]